MSEIRAALFLAGVLVAAGSSSSAQSVVWAQRMGGAGFEATFSIAADTSGHSYVTGLFEGTATFGAFTLNAAGSQDAFVEKVDPTGTVLWAKRMGGGPGTGGYGIGLDADGNTYVAGSFTGNSTFGDFTLASAGNSDIFVAKLDPAGTVLWATRMGGTFTDDGTSIAVDASGNTYVTGYFYGAANFGAFPLTPAGGGDVFVAKLDPDGEVVWARRMGGTFGDQAFGISVDTHGNSYVTGYFQGTAAFGAHGLISAGNFDIFVEKLGPDGTVLWARRMGGTGFDIGARTAADSSGNSYVTGRFQGVGAFGAYSLTSAGSSDVFVEKLGPDGTVLWARRMGGSSADDGYRISVDAGGNSYVSGNFDGAATFGTYTLSSAGDDDVFAEKLDPNGLVRWAIRMGGASGDPAGGIFVDAGGDVYLSGAFADSATLGSFTLSSAGDEDIFVARLGSRYAALGDSYSSGEGLSPYLPGTENACHRSPQAYPYQLSFPGISLAGSSFIACTGATTDNVRPGGEGHFGGPSQLDEPYSPDPNTAVVNAATQLVTLTIGGDDMRFAWVLQKCAKNCPRVGIPAFSSCESNDCRPFGSSGPTLRQYLLQLLPGVQADVTNVYRCIRDTHAPNASVLALGYPRLFRAPPDSCGGSAGFNENEQRFLNDMALTLNASVENAASAAGVHFVDVLPDFRTHEVCSPDPWVNGVQFNPFSGTFHPNTEGQMNYARVLDRFLAASAIPPGSANLPANPPPGLPGTCAPGLTAASTARAGQNLGPTVPLVSELAVEPASSPVCESHGLYVSGQSVRLQGSGFGSLQSVAVQLGAGDGDFVASLGNVQADGGGVLDAVLALPAGAPTQGTALVEAQGLRSDGGILLLWVQIGLSTSFGSDQDGDATPDPCDDCPLTANPDQMDSDGDRIGDACDLCPNDLENDLDGDGSCADVDPCPWDFANDADSDGRCETVDNCPTAPNADQADADGDMFGDFCDCAPADPGAGAVPPGAARLVWDASRTTLSWDPLAPGVAGGQVIYDLVWGALESLPVGIGIEACGASGVVGTTTADPSPMPSSGDGFWFIVRGRNACGAGTYGSDSDGVERTSSACP